MWFGRHFQILILLRENGYILIEISLHMVLNGPIGNKPAHWNENVFILMKFQSLAALEVVKMTTSSAASDENLVKNDDIFVSVH